MHGSDRGLDLMYPHTVVIHHLFPDDPVRRLKLPLRLIQLRDDPLVILLNQCRRFRHAVNIRLKHPFYFKQFPVTPYVPHIIQTAEYQKPDRRQ